MVKKFCLRLTIISALCLSLAGCDLFGQIGDFISDYVYRHVTYEEPSGPTPGYKPYANLAASTRSLDARNRQLPRMPDAGFEVFIRIFKKERELQVWLRDPTGEDQAFELADTYRICNFSGELGPKEQQGDYQSPEGFYSLSPASLNPNSKYHLSFNLGYPNKLERQLGRTGSALMVHGGCLSAGCYAMTDQRVEQVYTYVYEAFGKGQKRIQVHAFPFHLTDENLEEYADSKWFGYWQNLQEGYLAFEKDHVPPRINVVDNEYKITQL